MIKTVQDALLEKRWKEQKIEVYFFWNEDKPKNSGQVHIRSANDIGFKDGEIVTIKVDIEQNLLFIISTDRMRIPGRKAKETDDWRVLTQGNLKYQDFDFKHRILFDLFNIKFSAHLKGVKVRASNYMEGVSPIQFAIMVDMK